MRVISDIRGALAGTPQILQVENTPALGELVTVNGKFVVSIVEGATIQVDETSKILPVDGTDVSSLSYAQLLAMFPMYDYVYFNPLLEDSDVAELDLLATWTDAFANTYPTRAQVGRTGVPPVGLAPNSVAIMPQNYRVFPNRPGLLMTAKIDISLQTYGLGTDEFMVYWKIYEFETSHDILATFGKFAGQNQPAIRSIKETDQDSEDFKVYLSKDDGVTWERVYRLVPMAFPTVGTDVRIVFTNESDRKYYLSTYAFMF